MTRQVSRSTAGMRRTDYLQPTRSVYGTKVHAAFSKLAAGLKIGGYEIRTEVLYLNGRIVKYGTKGSARIDAGLYNSKGELVQVFDLKTGGARLTSKQVQHIQAQIRRMYQ